MKKCILLTIALVMLAVSSKGQDKDGELTVRISSGLVQGIIQEDHSGRHTGFPRNTIRGGRTLHAA